MFRPGLGQESPQGTPRPPYPGPPFSGMSSINQFGPPFGMQGRGSPGGQRFPPPGHPQHDSGQYPGYSGPQLGAGPPNHLPPSLGHGAPLQPRDVEMLKNIEILSGFVVKNGPQFEEMARQKEADDPKFGFLFGGEPGTEAAIGKAYYEWKKRCLIAPKERDPPSLLNENPVSPDGSDMDMEDDFEEPRQIADNKSEQAKELASAQHGTIEPALPSRVETNSRPQGAQNPRVPTPLSVSNQGNSATASQTASQLPSQVAVSSRPLSDTAYDELPKRKDTRRRTGFDRPAMEDVTPVPSPRQAAPPVSQEQEASAQGHRNRSSFRISRWGSQDQYLQQDTARRASPPVDVPPAPMMASDQDPERLHQKEAERPASEDRLEAVTPERDDDSEHRREAAKNSLSKDTRSEDRRLTGYLSRSDRDHRKDSPLRSEIRKTRDSDSRRSRDSPSRLEDARTRDVSPRVSKQQRGLSEPDPGTRPPTVDEFGRFIRPGGSESDSEDSLYDRRRSGSASRSRSRSPASRRRRRSRSRSPRRHGRWSRSRSRSPRRRQSWSRSPPGRDSRRGGDSGRGWDRGYQDRSDRAGRRGGRGDRGGGRDPPACLDFARGRCKRGSSCRFLHADTTNGSTAEGRHNERGGGRGGRGSRHDDRQENHDGGRSHGGGSSRSSWCEETPRTRRGWEPSDGKEKDYNKEPPKSFEQSAREQPETSPVSDYGDDFGAKPSDKEANDTFGKESNVTGSLEPSHHHAGGAAPSSSAQAPYSADPGGLAPPPLSQFPLPAPPIPHSQSQSFPPSSLPQQQAPFNMSYVRSQSGFNHLPPPPPPPPLNQSHHLPIIHQPSYVSSGILLPVLSHHAVGGQSVAPISRSGYTWLSTPTAAPASMAFSVQPVQASGASSYSFPPPPPPPSTTYTSASPQFQLPQQTQVGQSGGQFNMMSGRPEPGPPGAGDSGVKAGEGNPSAVSRHNVDHWKGSGGNGVTMHMDDVVLESVSPGLPGHHHMENVSPGPGSRLVMESVSPALVAHASNNSALQQHQETEAPPQQDNSSVAGLENVSPAPEGPQSWSPGGGDETNKSDKRADKRSKRDKSDKDDHKVRGLTLLRTAVAEHVKETLKPTWREGQMSKEAFKTIAKKAVDKVLSVIKPHQVPNTEEKVATYMVNARPKIAKLVQGYVDKYVKA